MQCSLAISRPIKENERNRARREFKRQTNGKQRDSQDVLFALFADLVLNAMTCRILSGPVPK